MFAVGVSYFSQYSLNGFGIDARSGHEAPGFFKIIRVDGRKEGVNQAGLRQPFQY